VEDGVFLFILASDEAEKPDCGRQEKKDASVPDFSGFDCARLAACVDGLAAKWVTEHPALLPVDSRALAPPITNSAEEASAADDESGLHNDTGFRGSTKRCGSLPQKNKVELDPWRDKIVIRD
jgi:hypothetical protein